MSEEPGAGTHHRLAWRLQNAATPWRGHLPAGRDSSRPLSSFECRRGRLRSASRLLDEFLTQWSWHAFNRINLISLASGGQLRLPCSIGAQDS